MAKSKGINMGEYLATPEEWEAIVKRVGKSAVQEDYAVGVKMEDNKL